MLDSLNLRTEDLHHMYICSRFSCEFDEFAQQPINKTQNSLKNLKLGIDDLCLATRTRFSWWILASNLKLIKIITSNDILNLFTRCGLYIHLNTFNDGFSLSAVAFISYSASHDN